MENEVFLYCEENDAIDMAALIDQFGSPEELANDFLPEIKINAVNGFIHAKHRLFSFLVILIAAVILLALCAEVYLSYRRQQALNGQYIESITYEGDDTPYITGPTYSAEHHSSSESD